jgi:hypothetical protein
MNELDLLRKVHDKQYRYIIAKSIEKQDRHEEHTASGVKRLSSARETIHHIVADNNYGRASGTPHLPSPYTSPHGPERRKANLNKEML